MELLRIHGPETTGTMRERARSTPIAAEADVVVLGGGPAGIAAAVSAARHGASTLLVERYGFLGGTGTAAMVPNLCGLYANTNGEIRQVIHGVVDELLERIRVLDGLNSPQSILSHTLTVSYDVPAYKCAADDLLASAGVDLRYHSLAVGAAVSGKTINAVITESKSGRSAIAGRVFIDCSGDGDLAAWAGAPFEKGGERNFLQYPTLMFRLSGVDNIKAEAEGIPLLRTLMQQAEATGEFRFARHSGSPRPQLHPGEYRANVTQISRAGQPIDGTSVDDLSYAEIEGRRQVQEYFRFLRGWVPGFERSFVQEIAPQVGIRETRRVVGHYQLTEEDVLLSRSFDDSIGVNGWPLERHVLGGTEWRLIEGRGYHQIPYRVLLPTRATNLLVAGRCASASSNAQSSLRVSGPCFAMGQAAGTAAALCVGSGLPPSKLDVSSLQAVLSEDGAFLG